ncbi:hypothetical protein DAI22_03g244800 [Oryza sativa Japonica Group]|nr:hypothetical protein DAI22_03g244800 [Oryza sativa Japonica Group]
MTDCLKYSSFIGTTNIQVLSVLIPLSISFNRRCLHSALCSTVTAVVCRQQLKMPLICMDGPLALTLYYVSVILLLLLMTPTEFDDSDLMYTNKECKQI